MRALAIPLLIITARQALAAEPEIIRGPVVVADGDSMRFGQRRGRLEGLDAFEWNQTCKDAKGRSWACGAAAKARLTSLVDGRAIVCIVHGKDRYKRLLITNDVAGHGIEAALDMVAEFGRPKLARIWYAGACCIPELVPYFEI